MYPFERLKESALEVIKNAIPSPEEQSGDRIMENENRQKKDAVVLVIGSRNLIGYR
jgi:hypothetical protein